MKFELDNTLIEEIIFQMEDQDNDSIIEINGEHFPIPAWTANDGYRLMEKFTSSLKNPILRNELTNALNRNKGVFRAFKDTLTTHPQAEKQWYDFKEKMMKKKVISWYNALREEWGLEPIGEEPEDNTHIVLEDFEIVQSTCCNENQYCLTAKTADGNTAGFICIKSRDNSLYINKLEVKDEFRGMGIGKTLLGKFLEKAGSIPIEIDVPIESDFFEKSLLLENFEPVSRKFKKILPTN